MRIDEMTSMPTALSQINNKMPSSNNNLSAEKINQSSDNPSEFGFENKLKTINESSNQEITIEQNTVPMNNIVETALSQVKTNLQESSGIQSNYQTQVFGLDEEQNNTSVKEDTSYDDSKLQTVGAIVPEVIVGVDLNEKEKVNVEPNEPVSEKVNVVDEKQPNEPKVSSSKTDETNTTENKSQTKEVDTALEVKKFTLEEFKFKSAISAMDSSMNFGVTSVLNLLA